MPFPRMCLPVNPPSSSSSSRSQVSSFFPTIFLSSDRGKLLSLPLLMGLPHFSFHYSTSPARPIVVVLLLLPFFRVKGLPSYFLPLKGPHVRRNFFHLLVHTVRSIFRGGGGTIRMVSFRGSEVEIVQVIAVVDRAKPSVIEANSPARKGFLLRKYPVLAW